MRKDSGTITGEVLLNGFPQERKSFLRVSGYVEVRKSSMMLGRQFQSLLTMLHSSGLAAI